MKPHQSACAREAYVGVMREEDIPDLMHQVYEPYYGAVAEGSVGPFTVATECAIVIARAVARGFRVTWLQ